MNQDSILRAEPSAAKPAAMKPAAFPTFSRLRRKTLAFGQRNWRRLLISIVVIVLLYSAFDVYASVLLNRELADIRARGGVVSYKDIVPPPVPNAENAALFYEKAFAALNFTQQEQRRFKEGLLLRPGVTQGVKPILAKNRRAIELAIQGGHKTRVHFTTNWNEEPLKILFPHYTKIQQLSLLLRMEGRQRAEMGDSQGALRAARAIYGMAEHTTTDPVLIGFLVGRGLNTTANETLAYVLEKAPVSEVQVRQFDADLPKIDWSAALQRSMQAERAFGISAFESVRQGDNTVFNLLSYDSDTTAPARMPVMWLWRPWFKLDEVYALRTWKQLIQSVTPLHLPTSDDYVVGKKLYDELPRYAILTRIIMPVYSRVRLFREFTEVDTRQREVALALAAYRGAKGAYPPDLKTAAAFWKRPLPMDLYRAQPMVYKRTQDSFVLYSVGRNGKDDRGVGQRGLDRERLKKIQNPVEDDFVWGFSEKGKIKPLWF